MEKHICKVCGRSFPTGRSLGGHMKTHVVLSSLMDDKDKPAVSIYGLRDNPKKSRRFDDVCPKKEKDHEVHAKRAKVCSSSNASYDQMDKDELKHDEEDDSWQADETQSQSNSEDSLISMSVRKRRRTPWKVTKISHYSAPPALSREQENEEMYGALCLLMFSIGTRSITDIIGEIPPIIERGKKVQYSYPSEDEEQRFKKPKVSPFNRKFDHGDISSSHVLHVGKGSSSKPYDCESCKRKEYVCTTCNKSFPSHQALGGHRTSHRKMKGANKELINYDCD